MIFRPIIEYEAGVACVNCWGAGKTFGDVPAPKRITMTGSGFVGACAVCNGTFIAEQVLGTPCKWSFDDGTTKGEWAVTPALTIFNLGISGGAWCFAKTIGLCKTVCVDGAKSMTIEIDDPPTPEHKIAKDQKFSPNDITYFDNFGAINGNEVTAICRRADGVRIFVEYEPEY